MAIEADFSFEKKKKPKQNQKINQENLLVVTQLNYLADLSHIFIGLTRCFT